MIRVFVFIILTCVSTQAAELYEVNTAVRALGMGNAYTAIVSDKDALFYNPARLANVGGINWTIFELKAGVNGQDILNAYNDMSAGGSSGSAFADSIQNLFGKKVWMGAGGQTAVAVPYFGAAAYNNFSASAYISNPAFPDINLNFINDYGVALGVAFEFIPEVFSIGVTGKKITRIGASFPIGVTTLASLSNSDLLNQINNRGNGYSIDLGTSLTIPTPVKPTFSYVWKNVGYTSFTKDFGAKAPPMIRDEMIAGFSMLIDLPGLDIRPGVDMKYINRPDEQLGKKLHFGIEFDFPLVDLRAGLHQGYYTLGVGVDIGLIKIDAATYGVELGEYPGQHEDRRYVAQLTMELGFDPSLDFLKGGDKKSQKRLKQRR